MKKIFFINLFFLASLQLFAQTDGISYQAVIIGPKSQDLPGVDAQENILPNAKVAIRFTILDANNVTEYLEIQTTNTDQYGRINLMIGSIDPDGFALISWDGTTKNLKVEIDFSGAGSSYVDMSRQILNFVPYAYHRNITARGTLKVDDATDLNGELKVAGPTNLNSTLNVNNNNATNLSGLLNVNGITDLKSNLSVKGITTLKDTLNVTNRGVANFSGNLNVAETGTATFSGPTAFKGESQFAKITVNGPTKLKGQVTIRTALTDSSDSEYANYPLQVEGNRQGIAIKVNGLRSNENNFISFWDDNSGEMWGRIEGQTTDDLLKDPQYILETTNKSIATVVQAADFLVAGFEVAQGVVDCVAASSSSTACVGLGACITAPIPAFIISAGTNLVVKIANAVLAGINVGLVAADLIEYQVFLHTQIGVTYQSGSGDYAEWLPKADAAEKFNPGDLVGVTNGYITKSTSGADKIMVISTKPIVLGNMPPANDEKNYEKIAFMGQVPVKVLGKVEPGDYILPSIFGSGYGRAVHPDEMLLTDYKKIAGVAWSGAKGNEISIVNVAVGMNTNDLSAVVIKQDEKIKSLESDLNLLKQQANQTTALLSQLVPGFEEANKMNYSSAATNVSAVSTKTDTAVLPVNNTNNFNRITVAGSSQAYYVTPQKDETVYFAVSEEQLKESISLAKEMYLESSGKSLDEHPFWKKMKNEPAYVEEVMELMKSKLEKSINTQQTNKRTTAGKKVSELIK